MVTLSKSAWASRIHAVTTELIVSRRILTFLVIGGIGAVIENGVLISLVESGAMTPTPGAVLAKECSIVVMFLLNERFTFAAFSGSSVRASFRRFLTSNLVRAGGGAVGVSVLYLLYTNFGVWYVMANVIGIGVGFVVNYVMESIATWRVHT